MTVDRTERVPMPGRHWYWVAGAVGVTSALVFVVFLFNGISGMGDGLDQMLAPGKAKFVFYDMRYMFFRIWLPFVTATVIPQTNFHVTCTQCISYMLSSKVLYELNIEVGRLWIIHHTEF